MASFQKQRERIRRITARIFANLNIPFFEDQKKLAAYKNCHSGKTAFIIGNGPSVDLRDLEKLHGNVTFCCNRFHLAYDRTSFRPDYTVMVDPQMISDFGQEIVQKSASSIFVGDDAKPGFTGEFCWFQLRSNEPFRFSTNIYNSADPGGSVVVAAIQLAFFMGIKNIYLYGVDLSFNYEIDGKSDDVHSAAVGDKNHFIDNYRDGKPWCPPDIPRIEKAIKECETFLKGSGGWIKNGGRGGRLEIIDRVDFDAILNKTTTSVQ